MSRNRIDVVQNFLAAITLKSNQTTKHYSILHKTSLSIHVGGVFSIFGGKTRTSNERYLIGFEGVLETIYFSTESSFYNRNKNKTFRREIITSPLLDELLHQNLFTIYIEKISFYAKRELCII